MIQNKINNELNNIVSSLLEVIPNSEEIQEKLSGEIQEVADEVISTFYEIKSKKQSAFKAIRKRMKSFVIKCLAKVCLMRTLAHLKKESSQETTPINESVEIIVRSLTSQLVVPENQNSQIDDSLLFITRHLCGDNVLVISKELSNLIYSHTLSEPLPSSVLRNSFR